MLVTLSCDMQELDENIATWIRWCIWHYLQYVHVYPLIDFLLPEFLLNTPEYLAFLQALIGWFNHLQGYV